MKNSIRTLTLTTLALAAALAVSAHAGTPSLSTATRTHGFSKSMNPIHRLLFPASTYMIDDGTAEDSVGFGNGAQNFESVWLNQFAVIPGATTISSVDVAWGTPLFQEDIDGTPVTIGVWSDPNGDGSPTDGVLLGQVSGTIENAGTDTFVTYTFSPAVALPGGATSFFVGDLTPANSGPEHFFQGIDQNSTLFRQSWVVANSSGADVDINNLGNNDFIGIIDDFGIPGNWLIRADGPLVFGLSNAVSRKGGFDIALPGVESRLGGANSKYTIIFTFTNTLASVGSVDTSCGTVRNAEISSKDAHQFVVTLTAPACDQQEITIDLNNVSDTDGDNLALVSTTMGLLIGDVNGDGTVDISDVHQITTDQAQTVTQDNFRDDVNVDAFITRTDAQLVKSHLGDSLP
jgi:hypothetical protein